MQWAANSNNTAQQFIVALTYFHLSEKDVQGEDEPSWKICLNTLIEQSYVL